MDTKTTKAEAAAAVAEAAATADEQRGLNAAADGAEMLVGEEEGAGAGAGASREDGGGDDAGTGET